MMVPGWRIKFWVPSSEIRVILTIFCAVSVVRDVRDGSRAGASVHFADEVCLSLNEHLGWC